MARNLEYQRVYGARACRVRGPITAYAIPNERPDWRLGLSVPRAVGTAVERHRLKRRLREAFRLARHDFPRLAGCGFDVILAARPHRPLPFAEYLAIVQELAHALHSEWAKREAGPR